MQGSLEPLGLLVAAIRRAVNAHVTACVEPLGLSGLQFWVLVAAAEAQPGSQAELARRLRFDEPTVSRAVASLARRGLLQVARDPADRRRVRLSLSATGRALADDLRPMAAQVRAAVEAPLEVGERELVRAALARIADHLQQHLAGAPPRPPDHQPPAAPGRAGAAS
jgi:DNA-binding MarR family transcriptional regulator